MLSYVKKRRKRRKKKSPKLSKDLVSQPTNPAGVPDPPLCKMLPVLLKVIATLICASWESSP